MYQEPVAHSIQGFILDLCVAKLSLEVLHISNVGLKEQRRYIVTRNKVEAVGP